MVTAVLALAALSCARARHPSAGGPTPPASPRHNVIVRRHGIRIADPWRWLDSADSPAVRQWIAAQNVYADTVLASFPESRIIAARVRQLGLTSPTQFAPQLVAGKLFYLRETPPEPQAELVAQRWPGGRPWTLVDPNRGAGVAAAASPGAFGAAPAPRVVAIVGFWPSPRGRYVAYATTTNGRPETTLHVVDLLTGGILADTIPHAGGGVSSVDVLWDQDQNGFTYTRFPPGRWFGLELAHHVLGRPASRDSVVFGDGWSDIAEYRLLGSPDGRAALLANVGDGSPAEVYVRGGRGWTRAADTTLGVRAAAFVGERLFVIATAGSPRGRLVAIGSGPGAAATSAADTATMLPERDRAIVGVAPIAGGFLVHTIWGMEQQLLQFTASGTEVRQVALPPGIAIGGIASSAASPEALIACSGWTIPERWVRYDGRSGGTATVFEVKPAADYSRVVVHEVDAQSNDGTHVPVTILARAGLAPDGAAPTILTSYGGFDLPVTPAFIGPWLAWIERGGVLAFANIRGGDEFGESWHQQAMGVHRQNAYDDFSAAARALFTAHWTEPGRLGIRGASNGGLLMGVELTQHPGQYRAVASFVGIYDMTRHQDIPNGRYNVPEYGSVDDSAQLAAMYAYSPLYHVTGGTAYPAVLLETGLNDPLVAPWQSREFAAALQWATSSTFPVLLVTREHAGHGSASFGQALDDASMQMAFFANQLKLF